MDGLGGAVEKLKQMMSTDEGQANIQNIISNFNLEGADMSNLGSLLGNLGDGNISEPEFSDGGDSSPLGNIDMETMMKMGKMLSGINGGGGAGGSSGGNNRHAAMLNSLKPYLSNDRKGKLDMAAKLMSLAKFAPLMKDML